MPTIKSWSNSRLGNFEKCPRWAKLAYIDRIPEPERPLPPGKAEHANDRGSRVHDESELFIRGEGPLPIESAKHFEEEFVQLKELFDAGKVSLEGEWAFTKDWEPVEWRAKNAWGRMKLDALVHNSPEHAVVIDYKTGRKFGNEVKHADQGQMYQLGTFLRYPELELIDVEFWYLDQDDITHIRYTRDQGLRFFTGINNRAIRMTEAKTFPANPNKFTCKWCPYGPAGTGDCPVGVQ